MKKLKSEILSAILVLSLIFLPSSKVIIKQQPPGLSLNSFEEKILIELEAKKPASVKSLIKQYRYFTPPLVDKLLNSYLGEKMKNNSEIASTKIDQAQQLAKIYKQAHGSKVLLQQTKLYKDWSNEQMRMKQQADSLNSVGVNHAKKGQMKEAIELWLQAVEIFQKVGDKFPQGKCLKNIGQANRNLGKYEESQKILELALSISKETEDKFIEADAFREIGVVNYLTGSPDKALEYWNKAIGIFKVLNDKSNEGVTTTHIGVYYKNLGKHEEALAYFNKALTLAEETKNLSEKGNILNNIGNIYLDFLADYDRAKSNFEQAYEIKKKTGEVNHQLILLGNIGICYKNQGNYSQALKYYSDALTLAKKLSLKHLEAKNLSDIGNIYTDVGDYENARPYYEKALAIYRSKDIGASEVSTLMNLAVNYGLSDSTERAEQLYEESLKKARKYSMILYQGEILANLGSLNADQQNYKEALRYYDEAAKIVDEISNFRRKANLHIGYGNIYFEKNMLEKALSYYQDGLRLARRIHAMEFIWQAYYGLGRTFEKLNKPEQAFVNYDSSITQIETLRANLSAISLKQSFMEDKIEVYEAIINLLLKLGKDEEAHQYYERSKARSFLDILSTGKINITEGISPERLKRKNELERELNAVQQGLSDEYSKSEKEQNEKQITSLEKRQKNARQKYNELLQEIELNHPRYATLTGVKEPLTLKQIQQKVIQPGTFLIEYLVGEDKTIVWIIGKNSFVYEKLNLKRDDLEKMVNDLLQPFRDVKEGKIKNLALIDFNLNRSQNLYQQIFQPIEKYLQKDNHLIIVPDGILHYLPFEALVTEIEEKPFDRNIIFSRYENAHYLVEKYAISYSSSASVLDPGLFVSDKKTKQEGHLLAFGNPDFSRAREAVKLAKDKENEASSNHPVLVSRSSRGRCYDQLPGAEDEVRAIAEILTPSLLYVGSDAKEENFKQKSGDFANVHLATHCIVEENQPMYSRIVFAQDDDLTEDGFLHTYEVFNLKLNAELVTLGACETGLGKLSRGEGLIGLTRAFMYAGAPSVVVSLWSVDESTAELMKLFYQNVKAGMTKAEALRRAKLKLIQSNGVFDGGQKFSFAQPYLWAAFVLVGEWK